MARGKVALAVVLVVIGGWSCKVPSHASYQYEEPEAKNPISSEIAFLSFKIREDTTGTSVIHLLDKRVIEGEGNLKKEVYDSQANNKLIIKQLDSQKKEVVKLSIDHPLLKVVEFVNESNSFETKFVKLEEAEFFIRIILHPKTMYIDIEEVRDDKIGMSTLFSIK
jgi:hypothetical protein